MPCSQPNPYSQWGQEWLGRLDTHPAVWYHEVVGSPEGKKTNITEKCWWNFAKFLPKHRSSFDRNCWIPSAVTFRVSSLQRPLHRVGHPQLGCLKPSCASLGPEAPAQGYSSQLTEYQIFEKEKQNSLFHLKLLSMNFLLSWIRMKTFCKSQSINPL